MPRLLYVKVRRRHGTGLSRMLEAIRAESTMAYKRFTDAGELRELLASDLAMMLAERFGGPDRAARWPAIPSPVSALVGRDADVAEVTRMLTAPGAHLVVLTGVGGAGKTRMALAEAEWIQNRADGAAFVDLSPVTDPGLVPMPSPQRSAWWARVKRPWERHCWPRRRCCA
jgi:predicted ATPase